MLKLIKLIKSAYQFTTNFVVAFVCPNESCLDRAKNLSASDYLAMKENKNFMSRCFECNTPYSLKPAYDLARKSGIYDNVKKCYMCEEYHEAEAMYLKQPNKAESIEEVIDGVLWGRVPLRDYCEECINYVTHPNQMAHEYDMERAYRGDYDETPRMSYADYQMELHINNGALGDYYESDGNGSFWRKREYSECDNLNCNEEAVMFKNDIPYCSKHIAIENKKDFLNKNLDESINFKKLREDYFDLPWRKE